MSGHLSQISHFKSKIPMLIVDVQRQSHISNLTSQI
jgi:hypothetical protein